MRHQDTKWCDEIIEAHDCLSKELSSQLSLTARACVQRRALLKMLLNSLDRMDSMVDCLEPSLEEYQWACADFFAWLDHESLQLGPWMIAKIQQTFSADHFFVRTVLPTLKKGLDLC